MRVLLISDVYFPRVNGVSTSIQTLRGELRAAGHEVTLVVPDYGRTTGDEHGIVRVPGRRVPFDPEDRLIRPAALRRRLDELGEDFDVVHVHTPFAAHRAGVAFARSHGIPVVETYHTLFEEYFYHYIPFLPHPWLKALARRISRKQCNRVDCIVSPSGPMRQALVDYGVTTPIEIIPTGLPAAAFEPGDGRRFRVERGIPEDQPVLLFVGRVAFEKNIGFLLKMLGLLRRQVPDVLLLMAGEGPALRKLKRHARQWGVAELIRFMGYLDRHTELPDCYRAADLFVFASKTETQGLVLLESMAQGTPVVALAEMGTKDVLREGHGCRIARDDPQGFADLVAGMLRDTGAMDTLESSARNYARGWSSQHMTERMVGLYERAGMPATAELMPSPALI